MGVARVYRRKQKHLATTVSGAFYRFRHDVVDLDPDDSETAIVSRDFLCDQLGSLSDEYDGFPKVVGACVPYGSFSRKTKICPLDDIDVLLPLSRFGTAFRANVDEPNEYWVKITNEDAPLAEFDDDEGYVDSIRVLNRIRDLLPEVAQYEKAEIHKRHQAVTLNLRSYDWVFDIVPALPKKDSDGRVLYYLIPDGSGDWMRTNPRTDRSYVRRLDLQHDERLRPTIRLLKYWNKRAHKPVLPSYYVEMLACEVFKSAPRMGLIRDMIRYFFVNASGPLMDPLPDPKGFKPDIDAAISTADKRKVRDAMVAARAYSKSALAKEHVGDYKTAIGLWGSVFGGEFPAYG